MDAPRNIPHHRQVLHQLTLALARIHRQRSHRHGHIARSGPKEDLVRMATQQPNHFIRARHLRRIAQQIRHRRTPSTLPDWCRGIDPNPLRLICINALVMPNSTHQPECFQTFCHSFLKPFLRFTAARTSTTQAPVRLTAAPRAAESPPPAAPRYRPPGSSPAPAHAPVPAHCLATYIPSAPRAPKPTAASAEPPAPAASKNILRAARYPHACHATPAPPAETPPAGDTDPTGTIPPPPASPETGASLQRSAHPHGSARSRRHAAARHSPGNRSIFACSPSGISPISSRNSVPPSAASMRPVRACTAPVNAPRECPNSSASSSASGIAAQFSTTIGLFARGLSRCSACATSSLPVPCLAFDQHGRMPRRHQPDQPCQLLDRRTLANHRIDSSRWLRRHRR